MAVVGIDIGGTRQGLGKDALIQAVPDFAGVQTTISPARGENRAQHAGAAWGAGALVFLSRDHIHPRGMAPAFKFCGEEGINDVERQALAQNPYAQRKHIGIIVLADHASGKGIAADAAADALDLVRGHHDALTGATEDDAEPAIARGDARGGSGTMLRIGGAFGRGRADIDRLPSPRRDMGSDGLAQGDGRVVAGEDDAGIGCHESDSVLRGRDWQDPIGRALWRGYTRLAVGCKTNVAPARLCKAQAFGNRIALPQACAPSCCEIREELVGSGAIIRERGHPVVCLV
jgi:hypothetical protein